MRCKQVCVHKCLSSNGNIIFQPRNSSRCNLLPDPIYDTFQKNIVEKKKILKTYKKWFITESSWPYQNTKFHFLIISEKHKEEFSDLKTSDFEIVSCLANWAIKKYKIKGGALTLRFGDTEYTGATVCHLHFHFIVPKLDKSKNAKVVNFPIG